MFQQRSFAVGPKTAGKTAELSAAAENAVAGDDDGNRIGAAGAADGSGNGLRLIGQLAVGHGLAEGDLRHFVPDPALKGRSGRGEGQGEVTPLTFEIGLKLLNGLFQELLSRTLRGFMQRFLRVAMLNRLVIFLRQPG